MRASWRVGSFLFVLTGANEQGWFASMQGWHPALFPSQRRFFTLQTAQATPTLFFLALSGRNRHIL